MSDYFSNIGPNLVKLLPNSLHCYTQYLHHWILNSAYSEPVMANELLNFMESTDVKKSFCPDNIGIKSVKHNKMFRLEPLLHLFNLSIETGIVSDNLKTVQEIPIF